jgi:hypothetical protein
MGPWWLLVLLFSPLLLTVSGCSGCNKDPATQQEEEEKAEAERKKKEAEKPKPNFESRGLGTLPPNRLMASSHCKPGHWTAAVLSDAKANNFDFLGDMEIEVLNGENRPQPLFATPFELTISRQIALSKGQSKSLDSVFFVPINAQKTTVSGNVSARGGGRSPLPPMLAMRMPSYQYHFLVLARTPESYSYLDAEVQQNSDRDSNRFFCIRPFRRAGNMTEVNPYYKVSYVESGKRAMLPSHAMLWTSIAVVLWDDAEPTTLDVEQQQALLDWLHWGGQIILSGPGTLDTLKGSFLEPYLPAKAAGTREISDEDLGEINAFSGKQMRRLAPTKKWTGVKFEKQPEAEFMPHSGELLVERRVGRGRIVVSAFRLSDRSLTTWPGLDEFYNAFLLRHPPRTFLDVQEDNQLRAVWSDTHKAKNWDAAEITNLRFFARDEGVSLADYAPDRPKPRPTAENADPYAGFRMSSTPEPMDLNASTTISAPGIAAWNDFSPAAREARKSLNTAARIEVPKRSFVVTLLAIYLGVLVPLNWSIFRAIGRVEWAWAAAPIVAVLCTVAVIRLAQLDIGFVRSRNEIAVLEIQSGYSRAHLTRYNALYTSLSTPYDFTFDDGGAAALPFPTVAEPDKFTMVSGQERHAIRYVTGEQAVLQDVPVSSNSTMLMHSEETFDLGGKLELKPNPIGGIRLSNGTKIKLQGIVLLKKDSAGNLQTAWIRSVEPEREKDVDWVRTSGVTTGRRLWAEFREKDPLTVTPGDTKSSELNLRELVNLAEKNEDMRPGEIKLVAWTDEALKGLTISPESAQSRHAAVVVAHLSYGEESPLHPDENHPEKPREVKYYTD